MAEQIGGKYSLVSMIALHLRQMIETGKLVAGDRLPTEAELLTRHGVSRTVLREAVNRLETLGMIQVRHGQGMFVGDRDSLAGCVEFIRSAMAISPTELTHFGEFLEVMECHVVRRAAEHATPEQITELESLIDRLDDTSRGNEESMQIDFAFHRKLFEIAGNTLMLNVVVVLQQFFLEEMLKTTHESRDHDGSQILRRSIIQAIRSGNPDKAEKAMKKHMAAMYQ